MSATTGRWISNAVKAWGAMSPTLGPIVQPTRLLLALKTAIAAGLAWPVAQLLPGSVDEYSYYAPLGALVSMMPTLMGSLKSSLQTAVGLAIGIGLAWLVVLSPLPGAASVPLVVGIGVLLGGFRSLGAGRDYVPIAALFVLVVGGTQAEDYSVGYLVQMAVGMAIGITVNLVIVPPLRLKDSAREIQALRMRIADTLGDMADTMAESWPPADQEWAEAARTLNRDIELAEAVLEDARESVRLNPRARRHPYDLQEDYDDLAAITRLGRDVHELGEIIGGAIWGEPMMIELPEALRAPLGSALAASADLIRAWNRRENELQAVDAAEVALQLLHDRGRTLPTGEWPDGTLGTITFSLRRLVATVQGRLDPP